MSYMLMGSIGGSLTFRMGFNHSSELVVDVRYSRIDRFWSRLNNSC